MDAVHHAAVILAANRISTEVSLSTRQPPTQPLPPAPAPATEGLSPPGGLHPPAGRRGASWRSRCSRRSAPASQGEWAVASGSFRGLPDTACLTRSHKRLRARSGCVSDVSSVWAQSAPQRSGSLVGVSTPLVPHRQPLRGMENFQVFIMAQESVDHSVAGFGVPSRGKWQRAANQ